MVRRFAGVMAALGTIAGAGTAAARPVRAGQLPNTIGCAICHVNPAGGGVRTLVGNDTLFALDGNNVDWPALCLLDSDQDMLSNGAELGDPNCRWLIGQPAPPVQSDPNDGDDPVEGGGQGGAGGGVGEPDRFCLQACDTIAACAVDGPRCPDLRPVDQAEAALLCAQECVRLPALPIAVDRAVDCDEMVAFLNGASPPFAEACGVDPAEGEGGAGGEVAPECVEFCARIGGCAPADGCPSQADIEDWCPDACVNQPALQVLAADVEACGDLRDLLEASAEGFSDLCRPLNLDAGPMPDGGMIVDAGVGDRDAGDGDAALPTFDMGPDAAQRIDMAVDAQATDAIAQDAAVSDDAQSDPQMDAGPERVPATVEGCTTGPTPSPATPHGAWWLIAMLLWRRRR